MTIKDHRPPHIYRDNQIYFLTSRTHKEICYFNNDLRKDILKSVLIKSVKRFDIKIYAWVILDNHYHLLFGVNSKFRSRLYGGQAAQFANPKTGNRESKENKEVIQKLRNSEMSETNFAPKYRIVEFIRKLHKDTSRKINKLDNSFGRKIWYQYWDHCIRDEEDFYKHFNYIHNNPIKHKKVKNLEELHKYKYSSFNTWVKKKGREWINYSFLDYPILDFTAE